MRLLAQTIAFINPWTLWKEFVFGQRTFVWSNCGTTKNWKYLLSKLEETSETKFNGKRFKKTLYRNRDGITVTHEMLGGEANSFNRGIRGIRLRVQEQGENIKISGSWVYSGFVITAQHFFFFVMILLITTRYIKGDFKYQYSSTQLSNVWFYYIGLLAAFWATLILLKLNLFGRKYEDVTLSFIKETLGEPDKTL